MSWLAFWPGLAVGGPYLDSAHGDTGNGVNRFATSVLGYSQANCAHCHEMHASMGGSEPAPVDGGADPYALFTENFTSQTNNFCVKCHGQPSYQVGGIVNRSYSYRAGGWNADTLDDIQEAFSFSSPNSSHNLSDISTHITGKWNYTAASNPCAACHNPHAVQGDPEGAGSSAKSSGTRGYPLSRPSEHDDAVWDVWGDDAGEKMSDYVGTDTYMAPHRFGTTNHEPDGTATDDGSNLTDMNSFCLDCHSSAGIVTSNTTDFPGGTLNQIDWTVDKHGLGDADGYLMSNDPYPYSNTGLDNVLACTDCHEPHGAPNKFLIRAEVNGSVLGATISSDNELVGYLCRQCHQDDAEIGCGSQVNGWEYAHHWDGGEFPYDQDGACGTCHPGGGSTGPSCGGGGNPGQIKCTNCHYHGATGLNVDNAPTPRTGF